MSGLRQVNDIEGDELEELRSFYEGNVEPVKWICERHGIGRTALHKLVLRHGWRQRHPRRINRSDVIERLMRLLDQQIRQLEETPANAGAGVATALSRLVNSLEKLIEMKRAEASRRPERRRRPKEISDIKARLIERIEQLKRG